MKKEIIGLIFLITVILFGVLIIIVKNKNVCRIEVDFVEDSESAFDEIVKVTFEAQDEIEAKEIADTLGIDYVRYTRGVGIYQTSKSIEELNILAEENGYPKPVISYPQELFE